MAAAAAAASVAMTSFAACSSSSASQVGVSPLRSLRLLSSSRGRRLVCCALAEPQTLEAVQKIIASQLSVNEDDVKPESKFADLGADSLDTVEIMMNLEENFKITLGEEGAEKIATVQDAANLIQAMISKS